MLKGKFDPDWRWVCMSDGLGQNGDLEFCLERFFDLIYTYEALQKKNFDEEKVRKICLKYGYFAFESQIIYCELPEGQASVDFYEEV